MLCRLTTRIDDFLDSDESEEAVGNANMDVGVLPEQRREGEELAGRILARIRQRQSDYQTVSSIPLY